jgi:hypothetical protein
LQTVNSKVNQVKNKEQKIWGESYKDVRIQNQNKIRDTYLISWAVVLRNRKDKMK